METTWGTHCPTKRTFQCPTTCPTHCTGPVQAPSERTPDHALQPPSTAFSGRWRGIVVHWVDGKRKRIGATFDYEYGVEQFIRDTEARLAAAGDVAAELTGTAPTPPPPPRRPSVPTLAEFADDWFTRRRRFLANGTVGNYRRGKDAILKSRLGRAELTTLHRADVEPGVLGVGLRRRSPGTISRCG